MIFPPLPSVGETPWHAKRAAWDAAVASGLNAVESTANTAKTGVASAAAREYWGPGRPDVAGSLDPAGTAWVAAATAGATFYSTDGPQGAWVWRKRGAKWVCVEGDTGALSLVSVLDPNFTTSGVTGGTATVTRSGNNVTLEMVVAVAAGASIIGAGRGALRTILTLPLGLGNPSTSSSLGLAAINNSVSDLPRIARSFPNLIRISAAGSWAAGDQISYATTLGTANPWPTTLTI